MDNVQELTDEQIKEELKNVVTRSRALYEELSRRYKGQHAESDNV